MSEINATLSFHMDSRHNDKHDLREIYVPYVDYSRTHQNYYAEFNTTREKAFEFLFSESQRLYNEKQTRNDRKIENYLSKLLEAQQEQKKIIAEKRRAGCSFKELKKFRKRVCPSYQFLISLGNMQDNPEFVSKNGSLSDVAKEILIEYCNGFQERNPNCYLYLSATHGDECGVWHQHNSVIFFADGFARGMSRQVSQKKALEAMGFYSDTEKGADGKMHLAIEKWQNRERAVIQEICKKHGINIVAGKDSHEHLDREHYIISQQKKENLKMHEEINNRAEKVVAAQEQIDAQLSDIKNFMENTDNGAIYSILAKNRANQEKISLYEKQNRYTYLLLANIWEQYKRENARYWDIYHREKEDLYTSLKNLKKGFQSNKTRISEILYDLSDSGVSLLGKLFLLIELLGVFIDNSFLKKSLNEAEQSYKELKDTARKVLDASKDTSIALKSKDIENVETAVQNWNLVTETIDRDLKIYFNSIDEQYKGR